MGDRANVRLKYSEGSDIYLYTHWSGSDLDSIIKSALKRGKDRWDDEQYLARIIFCEMVKEDVMGETGFGISPFIGDGDNKVVLVDIPTQEISPIDGEKQSFQDFVGSKP